MATARRPSRLPPEPPPEHAAADMLRVLLRRAEPAAKSFLRSLRQAEERERRASLPTSALGGIAHGIANPRVSKAADGLLRGIKAATAIATAGLESKFKNANAAKHASSRWTPPFSKK